MLSYIQVKCLTFALRRGSQAMSVGQSPRTNKRLRIGFVHRFDARKIRSWSGIFYFMSRALEAHVGEVVYLGPDNSLGTKFTIDNTARVNRYWQRLTGK